MCISNVKQDVSVKHYCPVEVKVTRSNLRYERKVISQEIQICNLKCENLITYLSKGFMSNVRVFADKQTDRQMERPKRMCP